MFTSGGMNDMYESNQMEKPKDITSYRPKGRPILLPPIEGAIPKVQDTTKQRKPRKKEKQPKTGIGNDQESGESRFGFLSDKPKIDSSTQPSQSPHWIHNPYSYMNHDYFNEEHIVLADAQDSLHELTSDNVFPRDSKKPGRRLRLNSLEFDTPYQPHPPAQSRREGCALVSDQTPTEPCHHVVQTIVPRDCHLDNAVLLTSSKLCGAQYNTVYNVDELTSQAEAQNGLHESTGDNVFSHDSMKPGRRLRLSSKSLEITTSYPPHPPSQSRGVRDGCTLLSPQTNRKSCQQHVRTDLQGTSEKTAHISYHLDSATPLRPVVCGQCCQTNQYSFNKTVFIHDETPLQADAQDGLYDPSCDHVFPRDSKSPGSGRRLRLRSNSLELLDMSLQSQPTVQSRGFRDGWHQYPECVQTTLHATSNNIKTGPCQNQYYYQDYPDFDTGGYPCFQLPSQTVMKRSLHSEFELNICSSPISSPGSSSPKRSQGYLSPHRLSVRSAPAALTPTSATLSPSPRPNEYNYPSGLTLKEQKGNRKEDLHSNNNKPGSRATIEARKELGNSKKDSPHEKIRDKVRNYFTFPSLPQPGRWLINKREKQQPIMIQKSKNISIDEIFKLERTKVLADKRNEHRDVEYTSSEQASKERKSSEYQQRDRTSTVPPINNKREGSARKHLRTSTEPTANKLRKSSSRDTGRTSIERTNSGRKRAESTRKRGEYKQTECTNNDKKGEAGKSRGHKYAVESTSIECNGNESTCNADGEEKKSFYTLMEFLNLIDDEEWDGKKFLE